MCFASYNYFEYVMHIIKFELMSDRLLPKQRREREEEKSF